MKPRTAVRDRHAECLTISNALSGYYVPDFISPLDVIRALNGAGVSFVLAGAHGLGGWIGAPRATEDVDVIVAKRHHKKAVQALLVSFPDLTVDEHEVVTRLRHRATGAVAIAVMRPNQLVFQAALKNVKPVTARRLTYKVPSLEMALALKFAPMVSLNRADAKKFLDAHDFIQMVQRNPAIDLDKLAELGELVYPGGGREIVAKVQHVRAGKTLRL